MIIDVNTFVGNWPFAAFPQSDKRRLLRVMREHGVEACLVSALEGVFHLDPKSANLSLLKNLRETGNVFPVMVINPNLPIWEEDLDELIGKHPGMINVVRMFPNYHQFKLDSPGAEHCFQRLAHKKVTVILHLQLEDIRSQHPLMSVPGVKLTAVIDVARRFKTLDVIVAGAGANPLIHNAEAINELSNIRFDTSWLEGVGKLSQVVKAIGAQRLLFGSQYPLFNVDSAVSHIKRSKLSEDDKTRIFHGNAQTILPIRGCEQFPSASTHQ